MRTAVDSSASRGISALPSSAVPILPIAVAAAPRTPASGSWSAAVSCGHARPRRSGCRGRGRRSSRMSWSSSRSGRPGPDRRRGRRPCRARPTSGRTRPRTARGSGRPGALAVALGVDLDQRADGLLADLEVAVAERRHERGDGGQVAQLAQRAHHLEPHARLGIAHQRGQGRRPPRAAGSCRARPPPPGACSALGLFRLATRSSKEGFAAAWARRPRDRTKRTKADRRPPQARFIRTSSRGQPAVNAADDIRSGVQSRPIARPARAAPLRAARR